MTLSKNFRLSLLSIFSNHFQTTSISSTAVTCNNCVLICCAAMAGSCYGYMLCPSCVPRPPSLGAGGFEFLLLSCSCCRSVGLSLALCEQSRLDFLLFQLANSNVYVLQKCSRYFEHLYAASPKGRFPQYTARSSSKTTANKR